MFNRILYINLDRRPDRKENVISELNKINYKGEIVRIPGIDWKTLDFKNLSNDLFTQTAIDTALDNTKPLYSPMTKGAIGCALAHRNAYINVLNSDSEYSLIIEDDITLDEQFNEKLEICKNNLPDIKYDILWLGYHYKSIKQHVNTYYDVPGDILFGLFGYVINKKAAKKLLDMFPITHQIDSEIPKLFPDLITFAIKEEHKIILSPQSSTITTYGTDIQIREDVEGFKNTNKVNDTDYYIKMLKNLILFIIIIILLYLSFNKYLKI
jgi:GR25 family glycosyltransferase involved in LPS biosynthesis